MKKINDSTGEIAAEKSTENGCQHKYYPSNGFYVCVLCGECETVEDYRYGHVSVPIFEQPTFNENMFSEDNRVLLSVCTTIERYNNNQLPDNIYAYQITTQNTTPLARDVYGLIRKFNVINHDQMVRMLETILCMIFHNVSFSGLKKHIPKCQGIQIKRLDTKMFEQIRDAEMEINEIRSRYNPPKDGGDPVVRETIDTVMRDFKFFSYPRKLRKIATLLRTRGKKHLRIFKQLNWCDW